MDISIVSSFFLHKHLATGSTETPITHKKFREVLMKELVEEAKAIDTAAGPHPTHSTICLPMYSGEIATSARRVCV